MVCYPVMLSQGWIAGSHKNYALVGFGISVLLLIIDQARERGDFSDQLKVITEGTEAVDSALEELVATTSSGKSAKYEMLYKVATSSIVGVATPARSQAQIFLVHDHNDHQHFVSVYTSAGTHKRSEHHFSSIGGAEDLAVWNAARAGHTVFQKNLAWHRLGKMPPGFKRWGRNKRYVTFITTPIKLGDEVLGLLTINSPVPYSLSSNDVRLVQSIARKISIGASSSKSLQRPRPYANIKTTGTKGCTP